MSNKDNFKYNYKLWKKTSDLYVNWVADTELRDFFSKNIKFRNLSLWWTTDICRKDNMLENQWFIDLKERFFQNRNKKFNRAKFTFTLVLKFFKNFIIDLLWYSTVKLFSFTRYKNIKDRSNCFHSINYNFFKEDNYNYDRCFGNTHLKFYNKNFFLISVIRRKKILVELFKKKQIKKEIPFVISDEFVSIKDIIEVYFKSFLFFFKLKKFLKQNKKLFFIKRKDCVNILEPLLLSSFSGNIQSQLLIGLSVKKIIKKNNIKNFFTYSEFNPGVRSIYTFIRNGSSSTKIISVQHGHSNENLMFFKHKMKEFTKKTSNEGGFYSPAPDLYLTQGKQFTTILEKYFPRKIKIIGCLKYDIFNFKQKRKNKKLSKINIKNKKIILLCPSIGDDDYLLKYLELIVNKEFIYILSPHPAYRRIIIKKYLAALENKCDIRIYENFTTNELLNISDFIICGFSTVAYEALFVGVKPIRAIDPSLPQFFDLRDKVPFAANHQILNSQLKNYKFNNKLSLANYIKKYYFHRLDNNSKSRFWKAL